MDGLEVEELFGFCAVAVTPPKKEVIIAQRMVKGESSSQRKELKSPPGKLTWGEKLHCEDCQNQKFFNSQRCLLLARLAQWQKAPSEDPSNLRWVPPHQAAF